MSAAETAAGSTRPDVPADVDAIDWSRWEPTERAVLCFVRDGDSLLLIHKKTGLGAGKVNAPGGRIDPGETAEDAAIREVREEVHVEASGLTKAGELHFQFADGYALHGTVFFASAHSGEPRETREADPFWCPVGEIPYEKMWEDDRHWLPLALAGRPFRAFFVFDGDRMLSRRIDVP
jgi:8-oxo-dGTP diphosphatase